LEQLDRLGASVLLPGDDRFPPLLRDIPEPPALLYAWGDVGLLARPAAGVVGSRNHTAYGGAAAQFLAAGVARAGVVVVSGMARGIDATAHAAALDSGGASVGVLGNGFGVVYPAANRPLYERMIACGCLVTELPPGERPHAATLPLGRPGFRTEARRRTRRGRPRRDERSANGADGAGNARAGEAGAGDAVWDHLKRGTRKAERGTAMKVRSPHENRTVVPRSDFRVSRFRVPPSALVSLHAPPLPPRPLLCAPLLLLRLLDRSSKAHSGAGVR